MKHAEQVCNLYVQAQMWKAVYCSISRNQIAVKGIPHLRSLVSVVCAFGALYILQREKAVRRGDTCGMWDVD